MYCPDHFAEERPEVLLGLINRYPLATVIRATAGGLVADHLPLLHEALEGTPGRLIGHVARANPLWQAAPEQEHLLVFQGPSGYVSPNWYASKQETGRVVPTWNYAVVHVHATMAASHDPQAILRLLNKLTDHHESGQPAPWQVGDAPPEYVERLLGSVVLVEFAIVRMQGKWKVSQNQPAANRHGVVTGLQAVGSESAVAMAALVQESGESMDRRG